MKKLTIILDGENGINCEVNSIEELKNYWSYQGYYRLDNTHCKINVNVKIENVMDYNLRLELTKNSCWSNDCCNSIMKMIKNEVYDNYKYYYCDEENMKIYKTTKKKKHIYKTIFLPIFELLYLGISLDSKFYNIIVNNDGNELLNVWLDDYKKYIECNKKVMFEDKNMKLENRNYEVTEYQLKNDNLYSQKVII